MKKVSLIIIGLLLVALLSCAVPSPTSRPADMRQKEYGECVEDVFKTWANLAEEFGNTPGVQDIHVAFDFDPSKIPATWSDMYVKVSYTF